METDTFMQIKKSGATTGGTFCDSIVTTGNIDAAFEFWVGMDGDTTHSTSGRGAFEIMAYKPTAPGGAGFTANANILTVGHNGTARFHLDADGDSHQDVGTAWTNFDSYDDLELLNALSGELTRYDDPLKASFGEWMGEHRQTLEDSKVVTFNDDGHHFINWSRTHMLEIGAIRQLGTKQMDMEARINQLEAALLDAGMELPQLEN